MLIQTRLYKHEKKKMAKTTKISIKKELYKTAATLLKKCEEQFERAQKKLRRAKERFWEAAYDYQWEVSAGGGDLKVRAHTNAGRRVCGRVCGCFHRRMLASKRRAAKNESAQRT